MKRQVQRNQNIFCIYTSIAHDAFCHNMCNVTLFAKPFIIPEKNLCYFYQCSLSQNRMRFRLLKKILYLMSCRSSSNAIKNDASKHKASSKRSHKKMAKEEVLLSHISSLIILIKNKIKRHNFLYQNIIIIIYLKRNPTAK